VCAQVGEACEGAPGGGEGAGKVVFIQPPAQPVDNKHVPLQGTSWRVGACTTRQVRHVQTKEHAGWLVCAPLSSPHATA
jgi:hypothetical protein